MAKRTKKQISYNMSRIRSRDTSIEMQFRRALRKARIRFRGNAARVFGKPDFIVPNKKIAIFCDGAFWHGYRFGKTNTHNFKKRRKFWEEKIRNNMKRDKTVNLKLRAEGWQVFRFWDFQIKNDVDRCIGQLRESFQNEK